MRILWAKFACLESSKCSLLSKGQLVFNWDFQIRCNKSSYQGHPGQNHFSFLRENMSIENIYSCMKSLFRRLKRVFVINYSAWKTTTNSVLPCVPVYAQLLDSYSLHWFLFELHGSKKRGNNKYLTHLFQFKCDF